MINKIYYINLDRRPERNEHTLKEISKINYNCPVERISAVDGKTLDIKNLSNKFITNEGINNALNPTKGVYHLLSSGSIGCALSHLNVYDKIIEEMSDDEYALILEDDIYVTPEFNTKLNENINKMPKFDILFLGYHIYINSVQYNTYGVPNKLWGLFSYIINKKAALEIKKIFPLRYQIDTEMPRIFKNLNVFYLRDQLILSDLSQKKDSQFPTDAQVVETFSNNIIGCISHEYILVILLLIFIFIIKICHLFK
jgi:GR25 family glycosyltransferase involved in LPS biosynthesis